MPPIGCTAIAIDDEDNIALINPERACVYKYLAARKYDSVVVVGGRNVREDGFFHPAALCWPNRQSLYILDDVLRRLVLLNTDLKVTESVDFINLPADGSEMMPNSFCASVIGELYLLNQLDNRVYRIDASGATASVFGGLDYGDGSLRAPVALCTDTESNVYVSDTAGKHLLCYDRFGIFRRVFTPKAIFAWKNFTIANNLLFCYDDARFCIEQLEAPYKAYCYDLPAGCGRLRGMTATTKGLYLLCSTGVYFWKP